MVWHLKGPPAYAHYMAQAGFDLMTRCSPYESDESDVAPMRVMRCNMSAWTVELLNTPPPDLDFNR